MFYRYFFIEKANNPIFVFVYGPIHKGCPLLEREGGKMKPDSCGQVVMARVQPGADIRIEKKLFSLFYYYLLFGCTFCPI